MLVADNCSSLGKATYPTCYQHFLCRNQMLYSIQKRKLPLVCNVYAYLHTYIQKCY
uniref:Uncharacterized protein n=1 Tax=Anguilla anguilla TaxID=7936 RepID=A0A0E9X401_ANGAN